MAESNDPNATRPIIAARVLYRCTCGTDLQLVLDVGGTCSNCSRVISPKVLQHEMAISTISDGSFELVTSPAIRPPDTDQATAERAQDILTDHSDERLKQTLPITGETHPDPIARSSVSPDVMTGRRFGHFEILTPLGRGGMGQVYRALDTSLQRFVAVKLLRSGIPKADDSTESGGNKSPMHEVDKLLQEAITQARVAHPNIVTIYFVGKESDDPFLAMELVNGKPLSARIEDGVLPFSAISSIAVQITNALKFSYELDLIHGDIKPSNILVQHDGIAKLSDFGMARNVSGDTNDAVGGTLNYIAPEILKGSKPSLQSDIYALGVTLYEMTFQELPIKLKGNSIPEWIAVHDANTVSFPQPWPDHLPEDWKKILTKMLAEAPEERYSYYDDLLKDLSKIHTFSNVIARPVPRIVAAGVDWISVLSVSLVLQLLFAAGYLSTMSNLIRVADVLPIFVYIAGIYIWRQSLGRSLMHVRVVNRFGHPPKPLPMTLRSLCRMQFPWCTVGYLLFINSENKWLDTVISVLIILSALFLIVDLAMMAWNRQRRSLHDRMFGTRVVVDIDASS